LQVELRFRLAFKQNIKLTDIGQYYFTMLKYVNPFPLTHLDKSFATNDFIQVVIGFMQERYI